jgi:hypothetical protein
MSRFRTALGGSIILGSLLSLLTVLPTHAATLSTTTASNTSSVSENVYGQSKSGTSSGTTTQSTQSTQSTTMSPSASIYCGQAYLEVIDKMKTSFVSYWELDSTQGNIIWEDISVSVTPSGGTQNYNGPGPVTSAIGDGDFTFYNLIPGTYYKVTMSGSLETDNLSDCPVNPLSVYVQM